MTTDSSSAGNERLLALAAVGAFSAYAIGGATDAARIGVASSLSVTLVLAYLITGLRRRRLFVGCAALAGVLAALAVLPVTDAKGWLAPPYLGPSSGTRPGVVSANVLSYLVAPATAALLSLALFARSRRGQLAFASAGATSALIPIIAGSKASIAAIVAAGLAIYWLKGGTPRVLGIATGTTIGALLALGLISTSGLHTLEVRRDIWSYAIGVVPNPLLGLGAGRFAELREGEGSIVLAYGDRPYNTHSLYVQSFVDFGVLGCALLGLLACVAWRACRRVQSARDPSTQWLVPVVASALVALAVSGIAESVFSTAYASNGSPATFVSPIPLVVALLAVGYEGEAN